MIGALVIGVAAPLILGDTSNKQGYINLVLIMTAVIFFFSIIGTMGVKERVKPQMEKQLFCKRIIQDSQSEAGVHYIPCCTVIFDWKQYRECSKYILLYIYF